MYQHTLKPIISSICTFVLILQHQFSAFLCTVLTALEFIEIFSLICHILVTISKHTLKWLKSLIAFWGCLHLVILVFTLKFSLCFHTFSATSLHWSNKWNKQTSFFTSGPKLSIWPHTLILPLLSIWDVMLTHLPILCSYICLYLFSYFNSVLLVI